MAGFVNTVSTINSALRTFLALVVVGVLSVGGYYGYTQYHKSDLQLREKEKEIAERDQRIKALEGDLDLAKKRAEKLAMALRLHKVEHRLAYIDVLDKFVGPDGKSYLDIEFTEINDKKEPIGKPRQYRLHGDAIWVAGWMVTFDDRFVESDDPLRGAPLFVFKSIFGDEQKPVDGFPLDKPGERPDAYADGQSVSQLEQEVWENFWNLAHDPKRQAELGIRTADGNSKNIDEVRKGWRYEVMMRSSGQMSLIPQGETPPKSGPAL